MMVFIVYIYIIMFCTGTSMNLVLITADLLHITIDLGLFQMDTEERVTETSMDDSEKHVIQLKSRSVLLSVTVFCFICVHMPVIRV